jgi:hypothetical protein
MNKRIESAAWRQQQVRMLRTLGMQVADKDAALVLVEMHNRGLFTAGLVLVGTLAHMAWLNEFGVHAVSSRNQDIDLARQHALKLATPVSFMETMQATKLDCSAIPGGLPPSAPSTSVKRPGGEGLRVDILTSGPWNRGKSNFNFKQPLPVNITPAPPPAGCGARSAPASRVWPVGRRAPRRNH